MRTVFSISDMRVQPSVARRQMLLATSAADSTLLIATGMRRTLPLIHEGGTGE
jgi:hypothetical protein